MDSSSLQKYPATYVSGPTLGQPGAIFGDPDTAVALDGGWIEVGDVLDFVGTTTFTLEAWVKPTGVPVDYARIMTKDLLTPVRSGWALLLHDLPQPHISFERWVDGTDEIAEFDTTLSPNNFTHVVATYDGAKLVIYLNGESKVSVDSTLALKDTDAIFRVGASNSTGANPLSASIDEVAVYTHALSSQRVALHHQVGTNGN